MLGSAALRLRSFGLLALLGTACSGGEADVDVAVPTGALGAPGTTVVALTGFGPDTSRAMNQLGRVLEGPLFGGALRQADLEFQETDGVLWLDAPKIAVGWDSLGSSRVFRTHWQALSFDERSEAFYVDLQILLDRAKEFAGEGADPMRAALNQAADRLVRVLGLEDFDSLLLQPSLDQRDGVSSLLLKGSVRAPRGTGGLPGLVVDVDEPPPLAMSVFPDAPLRLDLQFSPRVLRDGLRQLERGDDDVSGLLGGMLSNTRAVKIARYLVKRLDGRMTSILNDDGDLVAVFGVRPDAVGDLKRVLDRNLGDAEDGRWQAFADLSFRIDGDRLILTKLRDEIALPSGDEERIRGARLRVDPVRLVGPAFEEQGGTWQALSLLGGAFEITLGQRDAQGQLPLSVRLP